MMSCCGKPEEKSEDEQRIAEQRKCRDVLFLIIFFVFWIGMFIIGGYAFTKGNTVLITHGVDQYGYLCGDKQTVNGTTVDLTAQEYLYYLDPFELLDPTQLGYAKTVCVAECPGEALTCALEDLPCKKNSQYVCPYYALAEQNLYGKLQNTSQWSTSYFSSLASANVTTCAGSSAIPSQYRKFASSFVTGASGNTVCGQYDQLTSQYPGAGPCYPIYARTTEFFNRCVPIFPTNITDKIVSSTTSQVATSVTSAFNNPSARLRRYISDIGKGRWIIVIAGLGVGLLSSIVWMLILRFFAGLMVWFTMFTVNLLFIACTVYCYSKAGLAGKTGGVGQSVQNQLVGMDDPSAQDRKIWTIIAIIMTILTVLLFFFTVVLIPRLKIAIACLKVAAQAVETMPSILLFPIIPFLLEVGLVFWWIYVAANLYSAGTLAPTYRTVYTGSAPSALTIQQLLGFASGTNTTASPSTPLISTSSTGNVTIGCAEDPNCKYSLTWNKNLTWCFLYHFFGLLWTNQFIAGIGYVTIAGAVAQYYWTQGDTNKMPAVPVLFAFKNTILYHMGSIALGGFIVAIIQFVRVFIEYIDRRLKKAPGGENIFVKYCMCCLRCCTWYLEVIMKFINRNAYIMVAVKGTGYCQSAARAVRLIVANALRLVAVDVVGDAVIWLGKIAVAAAAGVAAFGISDSKYYTEPVTYPKTYLSSPLLPILIAVLVGYLVATLFFQVYEYAVATVILSFCEDCAEHNDHPQYAPPILMEALGEAKKKHEAKEAKAGRV